MQWTTLNELHAQLTDPHHRLATQRHQLQAYMMQAKMEQGERHHQELMSLHQQRMQVEKEERELEAQAMLERERIKGANDRTLATHNFMLNQMGNASKLIDDEYRSLFKEREDWANNLARTRADLLTIEADTLRQITVEKAKHRNNLEAMAVKHTFDMDAKTLDYAKQMELEKQRKKLEKKEKKLQHAQELEKLVLQYNLGVLQKYVDSHLQDWRTEHTKTCEILFRLVEQMLGLGDQQVSESTMRRMYEDALARAYP